MGRTALGTLGRPVGAHADNDPLNKVDPLGLRPSDDELEAQGPMHRLLGLEPGCSLYQPGHIEQFMRAEADPPCGGFVDLYYQPDLVVGSKAGARVRINLDGDGCSKKGLTTAAVSGQLIELGVPGIGAAVTDKAYDAFDTACRSHDYAYDIVRFARHVLGYGSQSVYLDRVDADRVFSSMMDSVCGETGYLGVFNKASCYYMSEVMYTGVSSWTEAQTMAGMDL